MLLNLHRKWTCGLLTLLLSMTDDNETKPVYGYSLEEHLRVTNRKIALPIQLCVCTLLRLGMEEEGLFRIASGASKLRRMKLSFDACCISLPVALEYKDPHVIAGALKSYLRELPEPLLTYKLVKTLQNLLLKRIVDTKFFWGTFAQTKLVSTSVAICVVKF